MTYSYIPSSGPRLTQLSHGGGCGCKMAPEVLEKILSGVSGLPVPPQLLVGIETADDAAVYQLNDTQAIVATTDFFMPIVDDPLHFGQIAATNAISDIYAMGGTPLFALAIVGMPVNTLPLDAIRGILEGGQRACRLAGIPIAGGHTIDSAEPIYGLVAIGVVHPKHLKRNSSARPGDVLILGKPLGVGVYSAALKKDKLTQAEYETMVQTTCQLNTPGQAMACLDGVHAITDVTGFGLLGHLLEITRGAGIGAEVDFSALPFLPQALELARQGMVTGASARNWSSYGNEVQLPEAFEGAAQALLTDPQTSGGLLVACAPEVVTEVLSIFLQQGFEHACVVGRLHDGSGIQVHSGPIKTV